MARERRVKRSGIRQTRVRGGETHLRDVSTQMSVLAQALRVALDEVEDAPAEGADANSDLALNA